MYGVEFSSEKRNLRSFENVIRMELRKKEKHQKVVGGSIISTANKTVISKGERNNINTATDRRRFCSLYRTVPRRD